MKAFIHTEWNILNIYVSSGQVNKVSLRNLIPTEDQNKYLKFSGRKKYGRKWFWSDKDVVAAFKRFVKQEFGGDSQEMD